MNRAKPLFGKFERIHMVGIAGAGMSGLAVLLKSLGCRVTGSDISNSIVIPALEAHGITVRLDHDEGHIEGADLVVYSAAVADSCPELEGARRENIPFVGRAEMLGALTRTRNTAAVAGTHGKTTTASMLVEILLEDNWAPSFVIGGTREGRVHAELGSGDWLVVEADEFDRSFHHLFPSAAAVTGIDEEHLDCYGDLDGVREAFRTFLERLPFHGHYVVAGDDPETGKITEAVGRDGLKYGLSATNDYRAENIRHRTWGSEFELTFMGGHLGATRLEVPGEHNVVNATGAAALAHSLGVGGETIARGLGQFGGMDRRFERRGETGQILVIDDYAHHPAEITATLAAARSFERKIVAVFQPHLYSRTRDFLEGFAVALSGADRVILADVYAARERSIPGVGSERIAQRMRELGHEKVEYIADLDAISTKLVQTCAPGDLVLTLGAGNVDQVAGDLIRRLSSKE